MKNLNNYITEAWSGVKQHTNIENIKDWCEDMGIKNYIINNKGGIDVNGEVNLPYKEFEELPYKFGTITGCFTLYDNKNLTSLKNCPNYVGEYFSCSFCPQLNSLEGCPKEVEGNFRCRHCKRKFTKKEVQSLCDVKGDIAV